MCSEEVEAEVDDEKYCFKILVPGVVIGEVIGPDGFVIGHLEKDTGAKIRLSRTSELYPGTQDRVCLLTGNMDSILSANYFIMEKTSEMRDHFHYFPRKLQKRPGQVKIIIPQCSASKIVGKRGNTIDRLKRQSGCSIQISQGTFNPKLRERCVVVGGEIENRNVACREILQLIARDTNVDYYLNVSYSGVDFPVPNAFTFGSAFARPAKTRHGGSNPKRKPAVSSSAAAVSSIPSGIGSLSSPRHSEYFTRIKAALTKLAYTDSAVSEACRELNRLYDQGLLDICYLMLMNFYFPGGISHSNTDDIPTTNSFLSFPGANVNQRNTSAVPPLGNTNADISFSTTPNICGDPAGNISADNKILGSSDVSIWNTDNPLAEFFNNRARVEVANFQMASSVAPPIKVPRQDS